MTEVMDVIRDLMQFIREESGIDISTDIARRVEARACATYGGERMYLPKLPKLQSQQGISRRQRQVQMAKAELKKTRDIAEKVGISQRQARRILNGK